MRIIACGSRDWRDPHLIRDWLRKAYATFGKPAERITIIHGAARGADAMVGALAPQFGFVVESYPADWDAYGRTAGPIRNAHMLSLGADAVVAFKDGFDHSLRRGGTEHMCLIAQRAGVPWELICHDQASLERVDL